MANTLIPIEERNLTPDEVVALDRRRRRGQLFLVLCFQCLIVATLVTLWAGQDLTYSPGWARPMFYWDAVLFVLAAFFGINGIRLRRGSNEFISY
jgi:di/tricarboxylate transporter